MELAIVPKQLPDEFKDLPPLLSTDKVASILGITRAGVIKMLERGDLPGIQIGRLWKIYRDQLLEKLGYKD